LGPVVRWPIDPVRYCDNCWLSNGGTCDITRVSVDVQGVEADCCNLGACAAGLKLYSVDAHCCNLGDCATGLKLYRALRHIVVTWECLLQDLSSTGC
jgi:hypothetical protein